MNSFSLLTSLTHLVPWPILPYPKNPKVYSQFNRLGDCESIQLFMINILLKFRIWHYHFTFSIHLINKFLCSPKRKLSIRNKRFTFIWIHPLFSIVFSIVLMYGWHLFYMYLKSTSQFLKEMLCPQVYRQSIVNNVDSILTLESNFRTDSQHDTIPEKHNNTWPRSC